MVKSIEADIQRDQYLTATGMDEEGGDFRRATDIAGPGKRHINIS